MRVLGIDPSVRSTGYAILEGASENSLQVLTCDHIAVPPKCGQEIALSRIYQKLKSAITEYRPDSVAMEKIIYVQSVRTAISMGSARGAIYVAIGEAGLQVHEYPARLIKQAATGRGSAQKEQMAFMMRALLGLTYTPQSDEADALAVALTHFRQIQNRKQMES
ncbi:MAG: crossover junction endodeoxyribonuclease RuvC [Verrucomicrobiota bacterium]